MKDVLIFGHLHDRILFNALPLDMDLQAVQVHVARHASANQAIRCGLLSSLGAERCVVSHLYDLLAQDVHLLQVDLLGVSDLIQVLGCPQDEGQVLEADVQQCDLLGDLPLNCIIVVVWPSMLTVAVGYEEDRGD